MDQTNILQCREIARTRDRDRYLCALFAPADRRDALFALIAFNYEIARIRETVSEAMLGEIRLQWWRDSIEGFFQGTVRKHPVAELLAEVIGAYNLKAAPFLSMIDARAADLYDERPKDVAAVIRYCEATSGTLAAIAANIVNPAAADASHAAGTAFALAGLIRALGFQAGIGRKNIPQQELEAAGIDPGTLYQGPLPDGIDTVVEKLAGAAFDQIDLARRHKARAEGVLLQATLAEWHLKRIRKHGYAARQVQTPFDDIRLLSRLAFYSLRGKY